MAEYVCIKKCFHKGRLFKRGDNFRPVGDEVVPHHFAPKGEPVQDDPTPRLGTKVAKAKPNPSMKAPGKTPAEVAQG